MSDTPLHPDTADDTLIALSLAYLENRATPAEHDRLGELLASDPTARRTFNRLTAQLFALRDQSVVTTNAPSAARKPDLSTAKVRMPRRAFFRVPPIAYALAAAILLTAAAVAIYVFVINPQSEIRDPKSGAPVATLIESTGTVIYEDDIAYPGSEYASGSYSIESGSAQFVLTNRVTVNLRGDTQLRMHSPMRAALVRGSAEFHCPAGAEGFTVALPNGVRVVDLGTAFGLRARGSAFDLVVSEGMVRLEGTGDSPRLLSAGQSVRIDPAARSVIAHATDGAPLPPIDSAYRELMLSMNPTTYLPMDVADDPLVLINLADPGRPGRIQPSDDAVSPRTEGVRGDALYFGGPDSGDWAILPKYKQPTDQLTIVAWVMPESRSPHASIAKNWGHATNGQFHLGLGDRHGDLAAAVGQADGTHIIVQPNHPNPLSLNTWHHVALVVTGERAILYRDGRRIAESPCVGLHHPSPIAHVGVGVKLDEKRPEPAPVVPAYWHGAIDELALFDQALTDEQVRELYEAARPEPDESIRE